METREKNKDVYDVAEALPSVNDLKKKVWKVLISPKIKVFLWRALSEAFPVSDLMNARGMGGEEIRQICGVQGLMFCFPTRWLDNYRPYLVFLNRK